MQRWLSETLTTGEACIYIMPPGDLIAFTELPTEQHYTVATHRREIYKPAFVIFYLDAEGFQFARTMGELFDHAYVTRAARHPTASALGSERGLFRAFPH
jgi:hypothetical protein